MYFIYIIVFLFIFILTPFVFLFVIKQLFSNKNNLNISIDNIPNNVKKSFSINTPLGNLNVSNSSKNINNMVDNNNDNFNEKYRNIKGNTKITNKINKKVIKYQNGQKISEESTETINNFEKDSVQKCNNCGAPLDLDSDCCAYCRAPIN